MLAPSRGALLALSLGFALSPLIASASSIRQVTFTDNPGTISSGVWVEDGVTAAGAISWFSTPGTVHLDPFGAVYPRSTSFTTGALFDVVSIDIDSGGGWYCISECDPAYPDVPVYDVPYPNVWITGFLDDQVAATLSIARPTEPFETISLGSAFARIDRLVVEVRSIEELGLTGSVPVYYAGHFNYDNVVLRDVAPIPEPSAAIIFGLALVLLRAAGRIKSHPSS